MRSQLLDPFGIEFGLLTALDVVAGQLNQDYAGALARALNDFQLEHFVEPEPRLKLAAVLPYESPELSVAEIERLAGHRGVAAVLLLAQSLEPLGRRRYWPIFEAAVANELPVLMHLSSGGGHPNTPNGWGSYHTEYHIAHVQSFQAQLVSLVCEGVFERFPTLKVILAEGGLAWIPPMLRRLDYHWERLHTEVPDLHRRPSEYVDDHLWIATQPIDEPDNPTHLIELFEELGIGNVLFSTDYPHFDFDSPTLALPTALRQEARSRIMRGNGAALFGLEVAV
jgi:predicted TIM-barrel fold metal-dependent hydrolase